MQEDLKMNASENDSANKNMSKFNKKESIKQQMKFVQS